MAIAIQNLTKRFGELAAVDSLTLSIENGELFGLVGSDGAGKTTTLRMLTGVMPPTSGDAVVLSQPLHKLAGVQQDIGYMSQRFGLYADLTVAENIRFYADLFGVAGPEFKTRSERLLAFSGMAPFTERLAGRLSGGMKQKLGLCCALIHKPKLLLLDEPTNGVDPVSRRDFWRILNELRGEGVTIVVATAYLDEAGRCDRVGLLHQGRLLACGTPAELTGSGSTTLEELVIREIDTPHPPANLPLEGGGIVSSKSNIRCIKLSPPLPALSLSLSLRERVLLASLPQGEDRRGTREGRGGHGVEDTVSLEHLTKRFGDFIAVDNISLSVPKGQIFGFLGPNGAGKSTTIRMLCGILPPTSGSGHVAGFDINSQPERIKENIGYMSQRFSLYEELTVEENIAFYGGVYRLPAAKLKERTNWVIQMAGLEERRTSTAAELSGGWKQRLALGCAILHEPPIVFLDEPTSGVDPLSRRNFWELIRSLAANGVTVFVTTHYMDEAEFCDRLALIYRGELVAIGTPQELKQARTKDGILPSLEDVFIGLIEERDKLS
ncbi:MAG TPA: ATP-binding cassette domain-containing protein [Deltaproteobacteria bacterium]|nr:ATP-binding cassette domain-containing protein [Deltaproteobacteria bacterium]HQB39602.1 ATP-binding cassette domain-containing protein [Deltaproteobacteria bacterium]